MALPKMNQVQWAMAIAEQAKRHPQPLPPPMILGQLLTEIITVEQKTLSKQNLATLVGLAAGAYLAFQDSIPKARRVNEAGVPVYSLEEIAAITDTPVELVASTMPELAKALGKKDMLHTAQDTHTVH
jgi:hypothetical protein